MVLYGQMRGSAILATVLETANENLREIACAVVAWKVSPASLFALVPSDFEEIRGHACASSCPRSPAHVFSNVRELPSFQSKGPVSGDQREPQGGGFYVKMLPRYSEPTAPIFGFKDHAETEAWIEVDRAKHRPSRRPKLTAAN